MKFKSATITKTHENERYVFKRGVAVVPGMRYMRQPVKITLKEFNEITQTKAN